MIDTKESELDGWLLVSENNKVVLAVQKDKIHDVDMDKSTIRVVRNIKERIDFIIYALFLSLRKEERVYNILPEPNIIRQFSAFVVPRVRIVSENLVFNF